MGINQYPTRYVSDVDVVISGTAPSTPDVGDIWVDTSSEVVPVDILETKIAGRNLLQNGAMQIHQRGTTTGSTTSSGYPADRWSFVNSSVGTWTGTVENDAPTGTGFRKSVKIYCDAADASPAASEYLQFRQTIEGQNLQSIKKGTANAEQLTLSFWVKGNKTGTYIVELFDTDNSRCVSKAYTINTSATWEQNVVTFPADTTGAFDNDNAGSLVVTFWLASGSDYSSGSPLNTSWNNASGLTTRVNGGTNLASATTQYIQFTGIQLETGPSATHYEHKDYGTELSECQRYYETGTVDNANYGLAGNYASTWVQFAATKRGTTTVSQTNALATNCSSTPANSPYTNGFMTYRTVTATGAFQFRETWAATADL